ncbi:ATP-binding cassette domain-containing protein [Microbacterium sp. NPDC096154]|uniref:ATP-binding cassette domain-containing protein n=1 Tax=Microbacterium sp. NPDC096154 TaxID=3155549 RepID=UPI00332B3CB5
MTASLLEVTNLQVAYPKGPFGRSSAPAIDDVTFTIGEGETLGLVGESGSGKSTTGRAILRLAPITGGTVCFAGDDIARWGARPPLAYRKHVQAVFQDPSLSLNPRRLVWHAIATPLRRHGITDAREIERRAHDAFERVGLDTSHLHRFPNELSGGQQQRVAIARAISLEPRLIVCDEAVSALDLSTQSQIINLLMDLQRDTGVSYLFIAHDLGIVRHISHRVGVMRRGRLVELGETEQLYAAPKDPYTRALLQATPASHPAGREERRRIRLTARTASEA